MASSAWPPRKRRAAISSRPRRLRSPADRVGIAALLFLTALGALYVLALRAYYVGFFNDDAFFLIGSRSLLTGRFVELNQPGTPPLSHYMPGYPLLLAPLSLLFPSTTVPHQLLSIVFTLVAVCLTWFFWRDTTDDRIAGAATALFALNPSTVSLSGTVLSDLPFLVWSVGMPLALMRAWRSNRLRTWAVVGGLIACGYYIRPVGLAFAPAVAVVLLLERRGRSAAMVLAVAGGAAGLYMLRNQLVLGAGSPYLLEMATPYRSAGQAGTALAWLAENGRYYLRELFSRTLFRWPPFVVAGPALVWTAVVAGSLLTIGGLKSWGWKAGWKRALMLYIVTYAGVHLVWSKQSGRYLLPLLPFACGFLFLGASALGSARRSSLRIGAALAVCLVALAFPVVRIVRVSLFEASPINRPPERTYAWVRKETPPDAVFAVELDGRFYLHTGRPVYHLPKFTEPNNIRRWLEERNVGYLVAEPDTFIMKTRLGTTVHDPLAPATLADLLALDGFELSFSDPKERIEIYALRRNSSM